nr:MAG TPA: hypothetical protein [Caudoviricetes sp.]
MDASRANRLQLASAKIQYIFSPRSVTFRKEMRQK